MRFVREATVAAVWILCGALRADAENPVVDAGPWVGVLALDPHLGDYRWDTGARTAWGASAMVSASRVAGGARVWRASTHQGTGLPGDARTLRVSLTAVEAIGEIRLLSVLGVRVLGTGAAGVLRLDWSPRELSIEDGFATETRVEFNPLHEMTGAAGLALRRAIPWHFQVAVGAERTWFGLDTAHRRGAEIVEEREVFGSWTGRVEITRTLFGL